MRYLSVCSGIGADHVAWSPLGWECAAFAEIAPQPSAVLAHHYPEVPNHGDFTTIGAEDYGAIDLLAGGTPCQSFSIAGLRAGLDDARGNLALGFCQVAARTRPRWIVWENVPGVLSADEGRAFGSIIGALVELGYGISWRILDAQYVRVQSHPRAVPQRRRRVFVVGYLGDWRPPVGVLLEPESMQGHPPPRREAGQGIAPTLDARAGAGGAAWGTDFLCGGGLIAGTVSAKWSKGTGGPAGDEAQNLVAHPVAPPVTSNPYGDHEAREGLLVAHTLQASGADASEYGTGRGPPLVPIAVSLREREGGTMAELEPDGVNPSLRTGAGRQQYVLVPDMAVRRITPLEAERLQGFPELTYFCIIRSWREAKKYRLNANHAVASLSTCHPDPEKPVAAAVHIDLERGTVHLHSPERWFSYAIGAAKVSGFPLAMHPEDFVRLLAHMPPAPAHEHPIGKAESQRNTKPFTDPKNGSLCVSVYGPEIEEYANGAEPSTQNLHRYITSTISEVGQSSRSLDWRWKTWCYCVARAIATFIPAQTWQRNSFDLSISVRRGYTQVPYKGKPMANGPRYMMLGNAWAVNVARYIGERIAMWEEVAGEQAD